MEFDSKMIRLSIAVLLFLAGTSIVAKNNDTELMQGQVDDILLDVHQAFNEAENDILNIDPEPDPEPEPLGPHPDASKCICKGTGIITHGDGHTTDCPYHKQVDDTKICAEDCRGDCDEDCNCANSSGCVQQASYQQEIIEKKYDYQLYVFSAEFCGPCKQLDRYVWQNLVDPKTYFQDTHKDVKNFLEKNSVKFQKYIWENAEDKKFFTKNSVNRFPTMILKRDGRVIVRATGYYNKSSFKSLITSKISKGR